MKRRKALFGSILAIALGPILWITGWLLGAYGASWNGSRSVFGLAYVLGWFSIIALVLGILGIITTTIRIYWDKEAKSP
jgi:MFS family permease